MDANEFLDEFIDNIMIDGLSKSNPAYAYFDMVKYQEEYQWLKDMLEEREQEYKNIDRNAEDYLIARTEYLKNIPAEDYDVMAYAAKCFDVKWSRKGKSLK